MTDDTRTRGKRGQDEATLDLFERRVGHARKGTGIGTRRRRPRPT